MEIEALQSEWALKKRARGIYSTSRWLSFLSVPWFFYMIFDLYRPTVFDFILAAGVPALPYLLVIGLKIGDKDPFYSSHAKQALFIVGLRFLSAVFVAWAAWYGGFALLVFFLGNGGLWLFGNGKGEKQVDRGQCWWAERFSPGTRFDLSDRNLAALQKEIAAIRRKEKKKMAQPRAAQAGRPSPIPAEPLAQARQLLGSGRKKAAIEQFAEAFRLGDAATRSAAARELEALGEVETF